MTKIGLYGNRKINRAVGLLLDVANVGVIGAHHQLMVELGDLDGQRVDDLKAAVVRETTDDER